MLAYNCSPSFNWKKKLDDATIAKFQAELGAIGYKFQFITLAGFHSLNYAMFELAKGYKESGMTAYAELQQQEFASEIDGYRATKHQCLCRHGLFRCADADDFRRRVFDNGFIGFDRRRAIR